MKHKKKGFYCLSFLSGVAMALLMVSCQSKEKKQTSSDPAKDTSSVFTTPKVLHLADAFDTYFKYSPTGSKIIDRTKLSPLSDVADSVEYVLLKTSNEKQEVFFGDIEKLFICKDYIFVQLLDNIIQYDRQGNLIRTIGRKGAGPGEYNTVYNMSVDDVSKRIIMSSSGRINVYDFDGIFIRSQKNMYEGQLVLLDSNRIAIGVPNIFYDVKERLVIQNRKGEVEKSFPRYQLFEHTDYAKSSTNKPRLWKFHDIVCFKEAYNDTIFELKNDELQMRYFLDWGKYAMKPEYYFEEDQKDKSIDKARYSFYETDHYLIIPSQLGTFFSVLYNKKNERIYLTMPLKYSHIEEFVKFFKYKIINGFYNDLDGGLIQNIEGISMDGQYIYNCYSAADVKDLFKETGYDANAKHLDKQAKLKALVDSIDEDKHNFLIMMSRLKE